MHASDNPALEKSYAFALQILALARSLPEERQESAIFAPLLQTGTSIGAHVESGVGAQPGPDFLPKMILAYDATIRSRYWLKLLHESDFIDYDTFQPLLDNCEELLKILGSISKSGKNRRF